MKCAKLVSSTLLLLLPLVSVAEATDPDWPCVQVLVPEIVPAVVWPEEIGDEVQGLWKKDATIRSLAEKLGDLERFTEAEALSIKDYAESIPESSRLQELNKLTDGIVAVTNRQRKLYINGIRRYTRQQIAIASQIETSLNQLAELDQLSDTGSGQKRVDIEETLKWHERIYDQRERSIRALCERPVEGEMVLSDVLRELSLYLP